MRYPSINRSPAHTVSVPALSGGLNLHDSLGSVADNQLTDCKNMWFSDGCLTTRPSLSTGENLTCGEVMYDETVRGEAAGITVADGGELYRLYHYVISGQRRDAAGNYFDAEVTGFFWVSGSRVIQLPQLPSALSFVIQFEGKLYAFLQNRRIYSLKILPFSDYSESGRGWSELEEEYTAPKYIINCLPTGKREAVPLEVLEQNGARLAEDFNILSPYYKMVYSSVNVNAVDSESSHPMAYSLLYSLSGGEFAEKTVTAVLRNKNGGVYTHKINLKSGMTELSSPGDGRLMRVSGKILEFIDAATKSTCTVKAEDFLASDLEITAPRPFSDEGKNRLFGMRRAVWFGGDAAGLHGGTRLFLGDNRSDEKNGSEKNLVMWSELLNPLYFAEKSFAKPGDSGQRVTAFGRQGDMLVIFKERETFFTRYMLNTSSAESTDTVSPAAVFPMIQLHSGLGCDCPDTVQLCRNRLVWACTDGRVYTLVDENQFSGRSIYAVSDMIEPLLRDEGAGLASASSADWNGHYFLFAGKNVYVMDYGSYGYANAASYNKEGDAGRNIPWWYWELPADESRFTEYGVLSGLSVGNMLFCVYYNTGGIFSNFYICRFDSRNAYDMIFPYSTEGEFPIESVMQTKLFDFGDPCNSKTVPLISVAFGAAQGGAAQLAFITGEGESGRETVRLPEHAGSVRSPSFIRCRHFRPDTRILNSIALRAESRGVIAVAAVSLTYRRLGPAR